MPYLWSYVFLSTNPSIYLRCRETFGKSLLEFSVGISLAKTSNNKMQFQPFVTDNSCQSIYFKHDVCCFIFLSQFIWVLLVYCAIKSSPPKVTGFENLIRNIYCIVDFTPYHPNHCNHMQCILQSGQRPKVVVFFRCQVFGLGTCMLK